MSTPPPFRLDIHRLFARLLYDAGFGYRHGGWGSITGNTRGYYRAYRGTYHTRAHRTLAAAWVQVIEDGVLR